jgi:thioredoxin 1
MYKRHVKQSRNNTQRKVKAKSKENSSAPITKSRRPVHLTDASFAKTVKRNSAVLIDFWADWCGPCKALAPVIEELAEKYAGKVFIGKMDIDENPKTTDRFGVRSIPTLVLLKNGKEVDRIVGSVSKRTVEKAVKKAFNLNIQQK